MAITINSITREGGSACDHLLITIDDNGVTRTKKIERLHVVSGEQDENWKVNIVLNWLRYQIAVNNRTFAQILANLPQVVIS